MYIAYREDEISLIVVKDNDGLMCSAQWCVLEIDDVEFKYTDGSFVDSSGYVGFDLGDDMCFDVDFGNTIRGKDTIRGKTKYGTIDNFYLEVAKFIKSTIGY